MTQKTIEKVNYIFTFAFEIALSETFGIAKSNARNHLRALREAGHILEFSQHRKPARIGIADAGKTILAVLASTSAAGSPDAFQGLHDRYPLTVELITPEAYTGEGSFTALSTTSIANVFDDPAQFRAIAATSGFKGILGNRFMEDFINLLRAWHNDPEGVPLPSIAVTPLPDYGTKAALSVPVIEAPEMTLKVNYGYGDFPAVFSTNSLTADALDCLLSGFHQCADSPAEPETEEGEPEIQENIPA